MSVDEAVKCSLSFRREMSIFVGIVLFGGSRPMFGHQILYQCRYHDKKI